MAKQPMSPLGIANLMAEAASKKSKKPADPVEPDADDEKKPKPPKKAPNGKNMDKAPPVGKNQMKSKLNQE